MEIIYRRGKATAAEIRSELPDPPSYSAVRGTLGALERKGHLDHEYDGNRYVYRPTVRRDQARKSALNHLLATFFEGSTTEAVATLLRERAGELSADELDRISRMIDEAREEGR